jgi:hypothetical protein
MIFDFTKLHYNAQNPYVLYTKLKIKKNLQLEMIDTVESQIETANYHSGYTFEVEDSKNNFKKLYNTFFSISKNIFGEEFLSEKNRDLCWANIYNKKTFRSNLHHHLRTSTINSVFYLKIPDDGDLNSSGLQIVHNNNSVIFIPDELEMVIMPSSMLHAPMPHNSLENRISINMEIRYEASIENVYLLDQIYNKCSIVL